MIESKIAELVKPNKDCSFVMKKRARYNEEDDVYEEKDVLISPDSVVHKEKKLKYETSTQVLLRTADSMMSQYRFLGMDKYLLNMWEDNNVDHTYIMLKSIKALNLYVNDTVTSRRLGKLVQGPCPRPKGLQDDIEELDKKYSCMTVINGSFISGTGVRGVYLAFTKYARNRLFMDSKIHPCIAFGYLATHALYGLRPDIVLGEYGDSVFESAVLPNMSSSGYHQQVMEVTYYDPVSDMVITKNTNSRMPRKYVKEGVRSEIWQMYEDFKARKSRGILHTYAHWPDMEHTADQKNDIMMPGTKLFKVRNYGLPPAMKVLCDVILFRQFHDRLYQKHGISIGHKWKEGGAHNLALLFEYDKEGEWFYIDSDCKSLDCSQMACLMMLIAFEGICYLKDGQIDQDFYEFLAKCSSINTAFKNTAWWSSRFKKTLIRYVVGVLFSGEFQTSSIDSRYVNVVLNSFDYWVFQKLMKGRDEKIVYLGKEYNIQFSSYNAHSWKAQFDPVYKDGYLVRPYVPREVYGDDILAAWKQSFYDLINYKISGRVYPVLLMYYLEKYCGVELKMAETGVYSWRNSRCPFLTQVVNDKIVRRGPRFLQRHFVPFRHNGELVIMPWRETDAYFARSAVRIKHLDNPPIYLAVLRGLQLDTCGTNVTAFNYLRDLEERHLRRYHCANDVLSVMVNSIDHREDWVQKLFRLGFDDLSILTGGYTPGFIMSKFFPIFNYRMYTTDRWNKVVYA